MSKLVLFHKTPAKWNKPALIKGLKPSKFELGQDAELNLNQEISEFIETDLYVKLAKQLCDNLGIDELHIVQGYSSEEKRNWSSGTAEGLHRIDENTIYWCIEAPEKLLNFNDAKIVFSRGNYQHLHNYLADKFTSNPIWINYPATALTFPHQELYFAYLDDALQSAINGQQRISAKVEGMIMEHNIELGKEEDFASKVSQLKQFIEERRFATRDVPYDVVLADDKETSDVLNNVYQNSLIHTYTKPSLNVELDVRYSREFDIFFCGTTLQTTKNHIQFANLLRILDDITETSLKVGIAGDQGNIPAFTDELSYNYENITVENLGEVPREELFDLFNNSRTLVVLSGRDCNPRIIQEAGMCGAYVIAADTLSDGFEIFSKHPLLGTIIPTKKTSWFYQKNGNLIFDVDKAFAQKVLDKVLLARFPYMVHKVAKSTYSVENEAQNLTALIRLLS
tara:strand:+ start:1756 stop:3114 length:1359 start_codon:yes stop_codon:yes gene_type:complete